MGLTVSEVRAAKHPGGTARPTRIGDGEGLYLQIAPGGAKSWLFRFMLAGKSREMGLGAVALSDRDEAAGAVSLARARELAREAKAKLRAGIDPIEARRVAEAEEAEAAAELARAAAPITFRAAAEAMLNAREAEWSNAKHRQQWRSTLAAYAYPKMGDMPVAGIGTTQVEAALRPIWTKKPETAARVRMRVLRVLRHAAAAGHRAGSQSVAEIGEALRELLPKIAPLKRAAGYGHHPALPWSEVPAFMADLRSRPATAARAMEFLILTATRTGETLGARWREFDVAGRTWTVPAERMKARKPHRVPLSEAAVALLAKMQEHAAGPGGFVFPGEKEGEGLSQMALLMLLRRMNPARPGPDGTPQHRWQDASTGEAITAHGFRSSFRDWAGETTSAPRDVIEMALAHAIANKTEAAYARGDLFAKRARLMEEWAAYCAAAPAEVRTLYPAAMAEAASG
jgi:integrase